MASYRVYCLDGADCIGFADWVEANSDDEAIDRVREMKPHAHLCEVWLERRMVAKLSPEGRPERGAA